MKISYNVKRYPEVFPKCLALSYKFARPFTYQSRHFSHQYSMDIKILLIRAISTFIKMTHPVFCSHFCHWKNCLHQYSSSVLSWFIMLQQFIFNFHLIHHIGPTYVLTKLCFFPLASGSREDSTSPVLGPSVVGEGSIGATEVTEKNCAHLGPNLSV